MEQLAYRYDIGADRPTDGISREDRFVGDMTQFIPSVQKMPSNSEALLNAAQHLTGMKKNISTGKWDFKSYETETYLGGPEEQIINRPKVGVIEFFMRNLTASDLINMKSDVMEAAIAAFAWHYEHEEGMSATDAKERAILHYRELQDADYVDSNGNRGTGNLQRLQGMLRSGALANMKTNNRRYLGLPDR